MRGPSSALMSSASRGRAGTKGVFPTNTSKQTAFSCFRTNSRAALVADVVGGSWGDHRLRDGNFKCQDHCYWHRCLDARRRFGCQPCLGGTIWLWLLPLGLFCILVTVWESTSAGSPASPWPHCISIYKKRVWVNSAFPSQCTSSVAFNKRLSQRQTNRIKI